MTVGFENWISINNWPFCRYTDDLRRFIDRYKAGISVISKNCKDHRIFYISHGYGNDMKVLWLWQYRLIPSSLVRTGISQELFDGLPWTIYCWSFLSSSSPRLTFGDLSENVRTTTRGIFNKFGTDIHALFRLKFNYLISSSGQDYDFCFGLQLSICNVSILTIAS